MEPISPEKLVEIVAGCSKGDRDAQQDLYKMMYGKMLAVCYRYSRRPEEAKDLLQDGFMKVFKKIHKFNNEGSLEGWIRRIMVNNAIDYYRMNKNKYAISESNIDENMLVETPDEDESIYDEINAKDIMDSIQKLSPSYRTVFSLFVLDGYSHKEIADELNISEGTSKSNLAKAKRNLRKLLEDRKRD
jgi:RNA polymerase sigma-70 factor (ECF subfamily)